MITSKNNEKIKNVRKLLEQGKARAASGLFVVEGERICREVPRELLREVYVSEGFMNSVKDAPAFEAFETVSDDVFKSMSGTVNPQGVLAVSAQPRRTFEGLEGISLFAVLDGIRDPGNMGTIIRTCEAAGAGVILSPDCVDIFNPKVIRSTMGSIFRVPFYIAEEGLPEAIRKLRSASVTVYAAALEGSKQLGKFKFSERRAFVIGNEANGVSAEVLKECDASVRIPMKGQVESLNAAVSCAVLLYHEIS